MFVERNEDQLLSVEEVCQQLFTSPGTVYKLLRSGEIKGFRVGSWKIPAESVRDYIKRKCQ
jgi:excisionase family DNA binding protein